MKKFIAPTYKSLPEPTHSRGFTLVELLLTIVVLGIVISVGIPNFFGTIQNGRLTAQTNQTIGMLAFARSEALKRPGTTITLCASSTINNATPTCNSNNWEDGWLIISDLNADQTINNMNEDLDGDGILDIGEDLNANNNIDTINDELLRIGAPLEGGNSLRTSGFANSGFIQFDSTGEPDSSGTFTICDSRGNAKAKAIVLSIIGHARIAVDEDDPADVIVNDHAGANVICPTS